MTPTEQDKELLREQVHKMFGDHQADDGGYQSCYDGTWIDMTNEVCAVADFITADRKRVALEARIDEQTHTQADIDGNIEFWPDGVTVMSQLERLAELKAQQEELEKQRGDK